MVWPSVSIKFRSDLIDKIELVLVDYKMAWSPEQLFSSFMRLIPSKYSIIIPEDTLLRADKYLHELQLDRILPGKRLQPLIQDEELKQFQSSDLLVKLFDTKIPQIFAESEVVGDGSDWNLELRLLGDISVAVPVTMMITENTIIPSSTSHLFREWVFTPGALLCNGQGLIPPDLEEVTWGWANFC